MKQSLLTVVFSIVVVSIAAADDWPQFRGLNRDGISKEKGLLQKWPAKGPKLLWTYQDAGLGHSSFAIAKGVLYTLGTDYDFKNPDKGATSEFVIAIDVKSGKELWRVKYAPLYASKNNAYGDGPRATPTIDGNLLFVLGGQGELVCFDISAKAKEVWRKNLANDFGGELMTGYGYAESPLIDGDHLLCTPGGANGTVAALDKKTGKLVWQSKAWTDKAPYSSVAVGDIQGVRQYVQIGFDATKLVGSVAGIEAKTGKLLWKAPIFSGTNDGVSTAPVIKGNEVFVSAPWGGGCHLFEIAKNQMAKDLYPKKAQKFFRSTFGGLVVLDDKIYGHSETGWCCQDWKTGDAKWLERRQLKCSSGAIVAADDRLFLYTDEGEVALVEASPKEPMNLISSFTIPKRSAIPPNRTTSRMARVWPHPAISDGVLYLRDHEFIFAFAIK
jgi:outer membrane protein assembly factor BamB